MWLYPGPSCLDLPFSKELGNVEVNTRIHKVLAHGADLNHGASPAPLREGVDSTRVTPFGSVFGYLRNFILSPCLCSCVVSWVCLQCTTGGHLAR
jgi:hypothetical protein